MFGLMGSYSLALIGIYILISKKTIKQKNPTVKFDERLEPFQRAEHYFAKQENKKLKNKVDANLYQVNVSR